MVGREEAYNINLDDDQIKQLQGQITDLLKENGKLKLQLKEKFPVITTGSGVTNIEIAIYIYIYICIGPKASDKGFI